MPLEKSHLITTTVHRCGCPIAQRAINNSVSPPSTNEKSFFKLSSATKQYSTKSSLRRRLKMRLRGRSSSNQTSAGFGVLEEAIKLKWPDHNVHEGEDLLYTVEIVVVALDRNFLLADCSEVVSKMSVIIKTGSLTTNEHATLEYLVKVKNLQHLQKLMDNLSQIQSVMSVERKFGSDLLPQIDQL
mmetsp:Transcript_19190/g.27009  ORF Transcript_19190/g.27009 Transcript_19190/m.27009 type:complete len:186 (-) Transcript_19190:419-976(-)